jgi:peptidoglycan/xylan/chitin deacetylase (PgdA/CDA1 family)
MTRVIIQCFLLVTILTGSLYADEKKGGISLAFDDGYPSWTAIIAPEIKKVGGIATGFVNNQRVRPGILSYEDLRDLQNNYGWEIGTHTYHHFHAPDYVRQKGMGVWLKEELGASLEGLASEGLKVRSLAFPFNDSDPAVEKESMKKVANFRRQKDFPIPGNITKDGSYPAASFELASYVPIELMFQWIDFARQQDRSIFLFGHKVLPDEEFLAGTVASISEKTITVEKTTGAVKKDVELCLVPNTKRRIYGSPLKVTTVDDKTVTVSRTDMALLTKPGASFIVGECYAVPVSYFRQLVAYAAERLTFLTVSQALKKASRPAGQQKAP